MTTQYSRPSISTQGNYTQWITQQWENAQYAVEDRRALMCIPNTVKMRDFAHEIAAHSPFPAEVNAGDTYAHIIMGKLHIHVHTSEDDAPAPLLIGTEISAVWIWPAIPRELRNKIISAILPCKSSAKHTESTDTVSDQGISLRDAMFNAIQDFSIAVKANDVEESDWQRLHALIALVPDDVVTLSLRAALGASHDDAMNYTRAAASEMARGNFNDGEENADAAARAEERFHSLLQLVPDTLVRG